MAPLYIDVVLWGRKDQSRSLQPCGHNDGLLSLLHQLFIKHLSVDSPGRSLECNRMRGLVWVSAQGHHRDTLVFTEMCL